MAPNEAVSSVLSKYADFSGRARRSEYWFWILALFAAEVVLGIVFGAVSKVTILAALVGIVAAIVGLAIIVPSLAVVVRRLHDTGKSGWWILLSLVPFGGIVVLVFLLLDSGPDNQYGPSPKAVPAYAV